MNCKESDICTMGRQQRSDIHTRTWYDRSHPYMHDNIMGIKIQNIMYFFFHLYKYTEMGESKSLKLFVNTD